MDEKACTHCKRILPFDHFGPHKKGRFGLFSWCKECVKKDMAERRARNPHKAKELAAKYVAEHRDEINAKRRARRAAHPERTKAERAASYAKRRERELERMREWKSVNRERMRARQAEKYWSDPDTARKRQMDYRRKHPGKSRAWTMNRIAGKLQATPPWANKEAIESIYKRASMLSRVTGIPHEVDHIVPLRSKHVSGLHCEANLQILTRAENRKKSNHFNAAMAA